ncbi:hypothetical protein RhiirC2_711723 [Rhizophagus irregularis]|uniref:Uncharacterized protein n=1 Tax=Rhizophagus irregularis TaxID=588596 RepID=A0A2N1NA02_9GLOM|nr:hypothetical protein RhiirC2_711723 [Rhizophagus irregularis]
MSSLFPPSLEETRLILPDAKYLKDHIDRELDIKIPLLQYKFEVVAICRPSNGCTKVVDIASSNLALKRDRIYHLRRLINLSKIIEALQRVIGTREMPEYVPILR